MVEKAGLEEYHDVKDVLGMVAMSLQRAHHAPNVTNIFRSYRDTDIVERGELDCIESIMMAIWGVVCVFLQLLGINDRESYIAGRAVLKEINPAILNGLRDDLLAFKGAMGAGINFDAAKELCSMVSKLFTALGIKTVVKAVLTAMKWYDWIIVGATFIAQVIVWVATDGFALAAEVALMVLAIATEIETLLQAISACTYNPDGTTIQMCYLNSLNKTY